jgi:hypothetical protein
MDKVQKKVVNFVSCATNLFVLQTEEIDLITKFQKRTSQQVLMFVIMSSISITFAVTLNSDDGHLIMNQFLCDVM